jgi:hypothetical protein
MTHTWGGAITIICECSYDDRDTSGEISFVEYLFYFLLARIESCTTTDRSVDDVDRHTCFLGIRHSIREGIILLRIGTSLGCE